MTSVSGVLSRCWLRLVVVLLALIAVSPASGRIRVPIASEALSLPAGRGSDAGARQLQILATYGRLPLHFEVNRGQAPDEVKFLARGEAYDVLLTGTDALLLLKGRRPAARAGSAAKPPRETLPLRLRLRFPGANPFPRVSGAAPQAGTVNYYAGRDPAKWRTGIPTYAHVTYEALYPGVDLVYYGSQRALEYDLVVAPGADPGLIRLEFAGSSHLSLNDQGDLMVHTASGTVVQRKPRVYQEVDGTRYERSGQYVIRGGNLVAFSIADYDRRTPLVIDPVVVSSADVGVDGFGSPVTVDVDGNIYVLGGVGPPANAGKRDLCVTKLDPTATAMLYSTCLGGSEDDGGVRLASLADGHVFVLGATESPDFPTVNAIQSVYGGNEDLVLVKLDAAGVVVASTYLGGSERDAGFDIGVDAAGQAYVTGLTRSTDFPTVNAFQPALGGGACSVCQDAFVAKFDAAGTSLVYSTYLGGSPRSPDDLGGSDTGTGIAADPSGNAYVAGYTSSRNFPTTTDAFQPAFGGADGIGPGDAFVTKLDPAGTTLLYSTYLGGSRDDRALDIAVDADGSVYVTGATRSTDFPTANAYQAVAGGGYDTFVTKLDPTGRSLVSSTYLGGIGDEYGLTIAVDATKQVTLKGWTESPNFPLVDSMGPLVRPQQAFLMKFDPPSTVVYSTLLPGDFEWCCRFAIDAAGDVLLTMSPLAPPGHTFLARISTANLVADLTLIGTVPHPVVVGNAFTYRLDVSNHGPAQATRVTVRFAVPSGVTVNSVAPTQGTCTGGTCDLGTLVSGGVASVAVMAVPGPQAIGTSTLTSFASSRVGDPSLGDNTAHVDLLVIGSCGSGTSKISMWVFGAPPAWFLLEGPAGCADRIAVNGRGLYRFDRLVPGNYTVTAVPATPPFLGCQIIRPARDVSVSGFLPVNIAFWGYCMLCPWCGS